jgi:hypothetical protein
LTLRRDRLDKAITEMAHEPEWAPVVTRLQCLRGASTLTAFALAVEIGDWERFTGSSIGAYLGLVPTENSSGERRSQGSITKAGNMHARRLLVEVAWHHRSAYSASSAALRARWDIAAGTPSLSGCRRGLTAEGTLVRSSGPAPHQSAASFKSPGSLDVGFADPGHIMAISLHQITVDLLLSNKDVGPCDPLALTVL